MELLPLLEELVRTDSVNPDLVPGGAGEDRIARLVAGYCREAGLEVELDQAAPGRSSVIAVLRGRGGGRSLMLNAHLDTVGVAGMTRPFEPRLENGRLYGRGAYDMKGGLAACLITLLRARELDLRGDLILTAVADEENASLGMQSVLRRIRADAAIVAEPTELEVCVAHKGFSWHRFTTFGHAAHGSRPDLGVDAIAHMGRLLGRLEALGTRLAQRPAHPLLGHASLHASLISGGQELSSYPERCTLEVERRTLPGEDPAEVEREFRALLDELHAADSAFRAELHTTLLREPFEVAPDAPIVQLLGRHAARLSGHTPAQVGSTFWMDAAFLSAAGIPTVVYGPCGAGAHGLEEWVDLASLQRCADVYLATAAEFCA
ncbi:acetylornithine deacetylase [Deinobacterium chartae]|uniref:Probable succinyl-diaminopimelate desuccinylase n=1 Tax=Deinobacterium chartae TaxID=521158 RepID=A0A841I4M1_9DEIO|nr:ArgE/DapE family deacylase [Deinobacterium chartae]MBB6099984.1 acetylornithine deacetylase [Deinobacterium chartae]